MQSVGQKKKKRYIYIACGAASTDFPDSFTAIVSYYTSLPVGII